MARQKRREINYNLRIKGILALPKALTTSFGSNTVFAFIKDIKNWSGEVCNCNICT